MPGIFSISPEDLSRPNVRNKAVSIFRKMLWAESRRTGISPADITIPDIEGLQDSGLDALVHTASEPVGGEIIISKIVGYQIKAGEKFDPTSRSDIQRELFGRTRTGRPKNATKENLRHGIKNVLDEGGDYVLIWFGGELDPERRTAVINKAKDLLGQCGYPDPKIHFWDRAHIAGFLGYYQSIILEVVHEGRYERIVTHETWARNDDMRVQFFETAETKRRITEIRSELRKSGNGYIRITGEPGIGKTKFVLEGTREEDIEPSVLYFPSPGEYQASGLHSLLLTRDNLFKPILVLDECSYGDGEEIWNELKNRMPDIKLITIFNEKEIGGPGYVMIEIGDLEDEAISKIIESYGFPGEVPADWLEFCQGSPRLAHLVGERFRGEPSNVLRDRGAEYVWDGLIHGYATRNGPGEADKRTVLEHIALFKKFGFEGPYREEAEIIARLIKENYNTIDIGRFREIVSNIKRERKILQGTSTLYITPRGLHIKLWCDWWDKHEAGFEYEKFVGKVTEQLLGWFHEMFKYASASRTARRVVERLFSDGRPFGNGSYLRTKTGARFFLVLTEADRKSALRFLKKTVGTWDKDTLLGFTVGRREVIWALEMIAMEEGLFQEAARLLLNLAEAENEDVSNNATGIFTGLFSLGPGTLAPTGAPPERRLPILKEALESEAKERRLLGIQACDGGLHYGQFMRFTGAERRGLEKPVEGWTPKTYGEWFDAYKAYWDLLVRTTETLPDDEKGLALDVILKHIRSFLGEEPLAKMVIETLHDLKSKPYVDREKLLGEIIETLHYASEKVKPEFLDKLRELEKELTGEGFSARMNRYVRMSVFTDQFSEEGRLKDGTHPEIEKLAEMVISNPSLLDAELDWLVTADAKRGYGFGFELGSRDEELNFLDTIVTKMKSSPSTSVPYFLGGYFSALFRRDVSTWEKELDELSNDETAARWVPELTWRSGLTDKAALRVLSLAEEGIAPFNDLGMFAWGGLTPNLSERVFLKWITFLLDVDNQLASCFALSLYDMYYLRSEQKPDLPEEITLNLLTNDYFFGPFTDVSNPTMVVHDWCALAKEFIKTYPTHAAAIAEKLVSNLGKKDRLFNRYSDPSLEVLYETAKVTPSEVWSIILNYIGPPLDTRAFDIHSWLRGSIFIGSYEIAGALPLFPTEDIWKWIDEEPERRAPYFASVVPPKLYYPDGTKGLAHTYLSRYGNIEKVRHAFDANFSTEGWTGSRSSRFRDKLNEFNSYLEKEKDENVKRWLEEYVEWLETRLESAEIEEEREDF